jgi:sarcosine oxidase subunit beta
VSTPSVAATSINAADARAASAVVIGAGIIGLTLARRLALLGVSDVVVLDAGTPGHQSTGRSSGGIRRQFGNRLEIEMSLAGVRFYEGLAHDPAFTGAFSRIGYAFVAGRQHLGELQAAWRLQQEMGVGVDWLNEDDLAETFPYMNADGLVGGTFCREDGVIEPIAVAQWLLHGCESLGVRVYADSVVEEIERDDRGVRGVRTGGHRIATPIVVNAAGAWAGRVGEMANVRIPVTPSPRFQALAEIPQGFPVTTPFTIDLETGAYMRVHRGTVIAGVRQEPPPIGFDLTTDFEAARAVALRASSRYPLLRKAHVTRCMSGLYELTADGLPIAGGVDTLRGFYVAAGFNGHGIMHGPPIAEAVAELIAKSDPETFDLSRLALRRFDDGRYQPERVSSLF